MRGRESEKRDRREGESRMREKKGETEREMERAE